MGTPELDARRRAPFRDAAAHGHDVDAEWSCRSRTHAGNIGPELLIGAAECGQYAKTTGLAHGRHQLDTAAALHGALQDRIADPSRSQMTVWNMGDAPRFVTCLRADDAAERPGDEFVHAHVHEASRAEVADHVCLRMGEPERISHGLAEAPVGRPPRPGALVIGRLADEVHLAAGQQRIVCFLDDARNHLTAVHGQIGSHDGDIAVGREWIAREVARLSLDAVGDTVLGNEFARDLAHHGQVKHHGTDGGMLLRSSNAVGPRATTDVHDAFAALEVDLTNEAAACAHADRVGRVVVTSRVGDGECLDRAHHLQVLGADVLAEPSPLVPLRLGEGDPGPHVAGLALDQETFDIGGVLVTALRLLQQAGRAQHHHLKLVPRWSAVRIQ